MSRENLSPSRSNIGDSIGTALPVELAAGHVDTDVLSALARWREVDQFSLHDLAPTLWTKSGEFIADNPGYLRALHGFVAEKVAYVDLSQTHDIEWPQRTNVPALDMLVDGTPTQIKEGTSAYFQVQHALDRYPKVTSFVTDPATAEKLQEHGVDATGVEGLNPEEIARNTSESITGLEALEQAGVLHVPILTSVFSICKYWERYDAGQIEPGAAVRFAATDIAAQSIGAAAGLKLAAVYIVATGGFGIAALPLTAGAIVGAMGLRYLINLSRGRRLREALQRFDETRTASEMAAEIVTDHSRLFAAASVERASARIRGANADAALKWARLRDEVFLRISFESEPVWRTLVACLKSDPDAADYCDDLSRAFAESDIVLRYLALEACLSRILSATLDLPPSARLGANEWAARARAAATALDGRRRGLEADVAKVVSAVDREAKLDLLSEYALLLERLTRIAAPAAIALSHVQIESEKLGAKWEGATAGTT